MVKKMRELEKLYKYKITKNKKRVKTKCYIIIHEVLNTQWYKPSNFFFCVNILNDTANLFEFNCCLFSYGRNEFSDSKLD